MSNDRTDSNLIYPYMSYLVSTLNYSFNIMRNKLTQKWIALKFVLSVYVRDYFPPPPDGVARYCFHHVGLCICLSVCPANILVFYFSAIIRDIDLKCIQD